MAIGVALIAAAGAAARFGLYQPWLELARQQAAEATCAYQALADAAQRQNAAVAQLQARPSNANNKPARPSARPQGQAQQWMAQAQAVQRETAPTSGGHAVACQAASAAFDAELKRSAPHHETFSDLRAALRPVAGRLRQHSTARSGAGRHILVPVPWRKAPDVAARRLRWMPCH